MNGFLSTLKTESPNYSSTSPLTSAASSECAHSQEVTYHSRIQVWVSHSFVCQACLNLYKLFAFEQVTQSFPGSSVKQD